MNDAEYVLQTEHLAAEPAAWLSQRYRLVACAPHDAGFRDLLAGAAGLVVRTYTIVDGALLDAAPRLRVVGRAGAGVDNIDVRACRARGVEVVYRPDANTQAVVEYVFCLLAPVLRRAEPLREPLDAEAWRRARAGLAAPRQMSEMTFGILGLGRVGRRVAQVAQAVGFERVVYNDLLEVPGGGASPVAVEALFEQSDVLTLHIDGRPENRHFAATSLLARMKPGVTFVNTSRGYVVDSLALAGFLRANPAAVALLDVHEQEPFDAGYPLLGLPNARLYPHLGAATARADLEMSWVVRDVAAVLDGGRPSHPAP